MNSNGISTMKLGIPMKLGTLPICFTTLSTVANVICVLIVAGLLLGQILPRFQDRPEAVQWSEERVLLMVHGLPIVKDLQLRAFDNAGSVRSDEPDLRDVEAFLPLIRATLSNYPPRLIASSRVRKVKLCKDLILDSKPLAALTIASSGAIYIDITNCIGRSECLIATIHHELFHVIDNELLLKKLNTVSWESLNGRNFRYGSGPSIARDDRNAGVPNTPLAGFVNYYSTLEPKEDRAEIFSFMMTRPDYIRLRIMSDGMLMFKVQEIRKMLNLFCPEMDNAFWATRGL
jgi:hypothetical protein